MFASLWYNIIETNEGKGGRNVLEGQKGTYKLVEKAIEEKNDRMLQGAINAQLLWAQAMLHEMSLAIAVIIQDKHQTTEQKAIKACAYLMDPVAKLSNLREELQVEITGLTALNTLKQWEREEKR